MALNCFRLRILSCGQVPSFYQTASQQHYSTDVHGSSATAKKFPSVATQSSAIKRGTGGRSSFSGKVVTVFGATGFLGRYVVNQLGKIGSQVVIPYRGDAYVVGRLKLCGDLGQILFMPYNLRDEEALHKAVKYSNVVINLVGRNFETANFPFEDVHVKGARNIARVCRESGVQTLIHMSALNACEKPKPVILKKGSGFLASKWRGEVAVREEFPDAVILRPSDIFGNEDNFLRYYASNSTCLSETRPLKSKCPSLVNWKGVGFYHNRSHTAMARQLKLRHTSNYISAWKKGEETIKQPVFVSDVAKGILCAAFDSDAAGKTYQAVGPHRYELGELLDWFHRITLRNERNYKRIDLRYDPIFWTKLMVSEAIGTRWKRLSWERVEREHVTDEISPEMPTLEDLGVNLTTLEDRIMHELKMYRAHAYYDPLLSEYIRPVEPAPFAKS